MTTAEWLDLVEQTIRCTALVVLVGVAMACWAARK